MAPGPIAITGLGAVTALGPDVLTLTAAVADGRCAIGPLTLFPAGGRARIAAQVPESIATPPRLDAAPPASRWS